MSNAVDTWFRWMSNSNAENSCQQMQDPGMKHEALVSVNVHLWEPEIRFRKKKYVSADRMTSCLLEEDWKNRIYLYRLNDELQTTVCLQPILTNPLFYVDCCFCHPSLSLYLSIYQSLLVHWPLALLRHSVLAIALQHTFACMLFLFFSSLISLSPPPLPSQPIRFPHMCLVLLQVLLLLKMMAA